MNVTLIGLGCGTEGTLTHQAELALQQADLIIGAARLLDALSSKYPGKRFACVKTEEILALILQTKGKKICVVYSGDTGFYSGARLLLPLLQKGQIPTQVLPGISSIQAFAAKLGKPWQDWKLVSAHGISCDPAEEVCQGKQVCFLTAPGTNSPDSLCRQLTESGLGNLNVAIGENLTLSDERITSGTARQLAGQSFAPLSVMLADPAPGCPGRVPGIPDSAFLRGKVPMTKQEIRSVILSKLAVTRWDVCWDIGAGTGSVSVELALQCRSVWAVERCPDAIKLIRANRAQFSAWNLHVIEGTAPQALSDLPMPDAVFVGGSGRGLEEILAYVHQVNPKARVCVSAIALETLHTAADTLSKLGYDTEICQIAVSKAKQAGALHLMMAQNPVFLITGVMP